MMEVCSQKKRGPFYGSRATNRRITDLQFQARIEHIVHGVLLLCIFGSAGQAIGAGAQTPSSNRVVILSNVECCSQVAWPEAEAAIRAELQLLNVTVEIVSDKLEQQALWQSFGGHPPMAVIQVSRGQSNQQSVVIDLWIYGASPDGDDARRLSITDDAGADNPAIVGVL